jgi:hypothetical protein
MTRTTGARLFLPLVALLASGCTSGADPLALVELPSAPPLPSFAPLRPGLPGGPTAAEDDYLDTTISAVFRRRPAERSRGFVSAADGYAVCARAFNGKAYDHALVVLQRRIVEGPVSQVEDDAVILRGRVDTRACRDGSLDWVPVG